AGQDFLLQGGAHLVGLSHYGQEGQAAGITPTPDIGDAYAVAVVGFITEAYFVLFVGPVLGQGDAAISTHGIAVSVTDLPADQMGRVALQNGDGRRRQLYAFEYGLLLDLVFEQAQVIRQSPVVGCVG